MSNGNVQQVEKALQGEGDGKKQGIQVNSGVKGIQLQILMTQLWQWKSSGRTYFLRINMRNELNIMFSYLSLRH